MIINVIFTHGFYYLLFIFFLRIAKHIIIIFFNKLLSKCIFFMYYLSNHIQNSALRRVTSLRMYFRILVHLVIIVRVMDIALMMSKRSQYLSISIFLYNIHYYNIKVLLLYLFSSIFRTQQHYFGIEERLKMLHQKNKNKKKQ